MTFSILRVPRPPSQQRAQFHLTDSVPTLQGGVSLNLRAGLVVFDQEVHFFDLRRCSMEGMPPSDHVMADTDDPFVPHPHSVVPFFESIEALYTCLDCIPQIFTQAACGTRSAAGAALKSAAMALKTTGGKVIAILGGPATCGYGALSRTDRVADIGSQDEWQVLSADGEDYPDLAVECLEWHVSVDLFVGSWGYADLASLGVLSRETG